MKHVIAGSLLALALSGNVVAEEDDRYKGVDGIVIINADPIERAGILAMEQIKKDLLVNLDIMGQIEDSRDFNLNFTHSFVSVENKQLLAPLEFTIIAEE